MKLLLLALVASAYGGLEIQSAQQAHSNTDRESLSEQEQQEKMRETLKQIQELRRANNVKGWMDRDVSVLEVDAQAETKDAKASAFLSKGGKGKQPVEQLEAWKDHNQADHSALSAEQIGSVDQSITEASWKKELESLLQVNPSRYVGDAHISKVEKYIADNLKGNKGITVQTDEFEKLNMDMQNIVGKLPGTDPDADGVLIGAHYDSIPAGGPAPGADDNASGVSTLLQIAKAISKLGPQKRTIYFVAFTGEEAGLLGSNEFANKWAKKNNLKLKGAYICDEVGFTLTPEKETVIFETNRDDPETNKVIDTAAHTATEQGNMAFEVNYHGWGSDHITLSDSGVPSVLVIERDNLRAAHDFGHTSNDIEAHLNFGYASNIAKVVGKSVLTMASDAPAKKVSMVEQLRKRQLHRFADVMA